MAARANHKSDGATLLLTVAEAGQRLSLGRTTVYGLVASGELRAVHVGRSVRIPLAEIEAFASRLIAESER